MVTLSRDRLWEDLTAFAAIGVRWPGTPGEEKARAFVRERLQTAKLTEVSEEEFNYLKYTPRSASVRVVHPAQQSFRCEPLQYSACAQAEGEVVYAGQGGEDDFKRLDKAGVSLKGKIVLTRSYWPFWIAPHLERRGAVGHVNISDAPEDLIRLQPARVHPAPMEPPYERHVTKIPALSITQTDGDRILTWMSTGPVRMSVAHDAVYETAKTANVVGIIRGSAKPEEFVVIGAHYDSQMGGGACDNATGIAALIEFARVFASTRPKRTLVLCGFAGEELGSWGSGAFVHRHRQDMIPNTVACLVLDAMSSMVTPRHAIFATEEILPFVHEAVEIEGWAVQTTRDIREVPATDGAPFVDAGVPTAWIWEHPPQHPYYHTAEDRVEYVDAGRFHGTAGAIAEVAHQLANTDRLPFERTRS